MTLVLMSLSKSVASEEVLKETAKILDPKATQNNVYTKHLTPAIFNGRGEAEHLKKIDDYRCSHPYFRAIRLDASGMNYGRQRIPLAPESGCFNCGEKVWGRRGDIAHHAKHTCTFQEKIKKGITEEEKKKLQDEAAEKVYELKKSAARSVFGSGDDEMVARAKLFYEPFGLIEEWDDFKSLGEAALEEDEQQQNPVAGPSNARPLNASPPTKKRPFESDDESSPSPGNKMTQTKRCRHLEEQVLKLQRSNDVKDAQLKTKDAKIKKLQEEKVDGKYSFGQLYSLIIDLVNQDPKLAKLELDYGPGEIPSQAMADTLKENGGIVTRLEFKSGEFTKKIVWEKLVEFRQELLLATGKVGGIIIIVMGHAAIGEASQNTLFEMSRDDNYVREYLSTERIVDFFDCTSLENVPKIFIFHGCRKPTTKSIRDETFYQESELVTQKPEHQQKDTLICHTTNPRRLAHGYSVLNEVFRSIKSFGHLLDFKRILIRANTQLAIMDKEQVNTDSRGFDRLFFLTKEAEENYEVIA